MGEATVQATGDTRSCPQCGAPLDAGDRFCRKCGLEQHPDAAAVSALIERMLPGRIDAALKERLRDQKVVEVETAEALADRAIKWLRTLGFFVGIPVALVAAIFSFFGITGWSELRRVSQETLDLQKNLVEPQKRLAQANQQIEKLQVDLDEAKKALDKKIAAVNTRQDNIDDQLKAIRNRLEFCPGGSASDALKEKLEDSLSRFIVWLQGVGFDNLEDRVSVCVFSKDAPLPDQFKSMSDVVNAFYSSNALYIHQSLAENVSVALREYGHHALSKSARPEAFKQTEVETAVADYLPASFTGSPVIGANLGALFGLKTPYIRTLDNTVVYTSTSSDDLFARGQAWSGALWSCRSRQQAGIDRLVLAAWRVATAAAMPDAESAKKFGATLAGAPEPLGTCLRNEMTRRGLPS